MSEKLNFQDRLLSLGLARVSEAAALASAKLIGRGDEKAADQAEHGPAPVGPAHVSVAPTAPLRLIEQSGWSIGYDAFTAVGGLSLPRRLTATSGGVRVRVLVDRWTLPPEGSGRP